MRTTLISGVYIFNVYSNFFLVPTIHVLFDAFFALVVKSFLGVKLGSGERYVTKYTGDFIPSDTVQYNAVQVASKSFLLLKSHNLFTRHFPTS